MQFRQPTQCADGVAHYAYYDKAHNLSFVWSGDKKAMIEVCYGGYGEPVVAAFKPPAVSLEGFKKACDAWIEEHDKEKP